MLEIFCFSSIGFLHLVGNSNNNNNQNSASKVMPRFDLGITIWMNQVLKEDLNTWIFFTVNQGQPDINTNHRHKKVPLKIFIKKLLKLILPNYWFTVPSRQLSQKGLEKWFCISIKTFSSSYYDSFFKKVYNTLYNRQKCK